MSFGIYRMHGPLLAVGFTALEATNEFKKTLGENKVKVPFIDDRHALHMGDDDQDEAGVITMRLCSEQLAKQFRENKFVAYKLNERFVLDVIPKKTLDLYEQRAKEVMSKSPVKFLGVQGNWRCGRADNPEGILSAGTSYNILDVEVHSFHTLIQLEAAPGKWFDTSNFEKV